MALVLQTAFFFSPIPSYFSSLSVFLTSSPILHPALNSIRTHLYLWKKFDFLLAGGSSWDNVYVMKGNAFIFQKLQNLLAVYRNIIMSYVWKSPRKLNLLYCIYSKKWMKKLKRGKEDKYLITSVTFTDIHLCENTGTLSDLKAICKCLIKWTYFLIQHRWLT